MIKVIKLILIFIAGTIIGATISTHKIANIKANCSKEIDSLKRTIHDQASDIDALEDSCREKESEISYWGQKYDSCLNSK
jgi:hypothetical protein